MKSITKITRNKNTEEFCQRNEYNNKYKQKCDRYPFTAK